MNEGANMAVVNHPNPPHSWVDADGNVDWDAHADGLVAVCDDCYDGPESIGYARFPGRGTSYYFKLAGRDVQLYVTEKRKRVRVFVDGAEYKR